jgi:DNA-binding transcriptional LysR family regulator
MRIAYVACAERMTFAQLRTLLAVVEEGSFTAAAARVRVSQPAVSRAIASLEAELGATLVRRGRGELQLTDAGRAAVAHAREVVQHEEALRASVATAATPIRGMLLLASMPSITGTLLPPRVRRFRDRHPDVDMRLFEGSDDEVRAWLANGAAEIGVVTLPAPGFETQPLGSDEFFAVLPLDHPLANLPAIPFAELSNEPFIIPSGGCAPLIVDAARRAHARLAVRFEAADVASLVGMVASGFGVSIAPTLGLSRPTPGVVTRPLEPRTPRALALAVRSRSEISSQAEAFLATAAEVD